MSQGVREGPGSAALKSRSFWPDVISIVGIISIVIAITAFP